MKIESKVESLNCYNVKLSQWREPFCDSTIQPFNHSTDSAFTLIEMILAIGISALVLITITTVLFSALHLRDATNDLVDSVSPIDQAATFLRRDLACVMTPTNGTSKILSGDFKVGNVSSDGISTPVAIEMFTATGALGESTPWGDVQRVTYELKNSTDASAPGQDLYRSVTRNLLSSSTPDVTDQLMLNGVTSVKFSCYDGAIWQDTWDTTGLTSANTNLPVAVRVEIQMAGNNSAAPVEMVVPIDSQTRTNVVLTTTAEN